MDMLVDDDDGAGDVFIGAGLRDGDGDCIGCGRGKIEGNVVGHEKRRAACV